MEAGGRSMAVLAHGLHRVYPEANKKLHDQLVTQGAIVSEFPLGVDPRPAYFPRRNRIISGLARGVLVVEAGPVSGALITARWAGEQGREVFAVPGSYNAWLCRGTHALIQDGAKLVTCIQDILDELPSQQVLPETHQQPKDSFRQELNRGQNIILQALEAGGLQVNQLAAVCERPVNLVLAELLIMELQGLVQGTPGQVYYRVKG
jgi:DNA processing protein